MVDVAAPGDRAVQQSAVDDAVVAGQGVRTAPEIRTGPPASSM